MECWRSRCSGGGGDEGEGDESGDEDEQGEKEVMRTWSKQEDLERKRRRVGESKVEMRNEMTRSSSCLHVFFSGPRHWFAAAPVVTRTLKNFLILQNVLMREIQTVVCVFKFYFHLSSFLLLLLLLL